MHTITDSMVKRTFDFFRSVYKIIVSLNLPKEVTSVTAEISEDTKWNSQVNTLENLTSRHHLFQPSQRLCWHHGELKELRLTIKTFCTVNSPPKDGKSLPPIRTHVILKKIPYQICAGKIRVYIQKIWKISFVGFSPQYRDF